MRPPRSGRRGSSFLAVLLAALLPAPAAPAAELEVIAHRGLHPVADPARAAGPCPEVHVLPAEHHLLENTLPSLQAAFERGATLVEVDIRASADGRLVAFHDETLDCRTDGSGPLARATWAELRRLDVGFGYTSDGGKSHPWRGRGVGLLPSLEELLAALPERRLLLHQKDPNPETTRLLARALSALPPARQARLHYWGSAERFAALRRAAPGLAPARFLAWGSLRGCAARFALLRSWGGFPAACRESALLLPDAWATRAPGFFRSFGEAARDAGSRLYLAGADSAEALARARAIAADGIMTDRIGEVAPLLATEPLY